MAYLQDMKTTPHPYTAQPCASCQAPNLYLPQGQHRDRTLAREQMMPLRLHDYVSQELQTQVPPDR
jgi:hypothetical protein